LVLVLKNFPLAGISMTNKEMTKKAAEHIADCYPTNTFNIGISHVSEKGMNCIAAVTTLGRMLVQVHKIHFDPEGTITACDPPLPVGV